MRERIREDLLNEGGELVETHISVVFLVGDDVYKLKKSVDLGFCDFSTLDKRRAACEAEVELNRRLAPDVYLGVEPVTRDADGRYRIGGDGEPVEWAVHMRRLPEASRADKRIAEGGLEAAHVERIAKQLAEFHAASRADEATAQWGTPEAMQRNVEENFEQTRDTIGRYLDAEQAAEVRRWQLDVLRQKSALFEARIAASRVRDGHGDLRLEQIYVDDQGEPTILDCIEFNDRLRYGDVAVDIAFLAMDLAWHGRVDLAERFLAAYARAAGDYDFYPLIDFYESYRAFVRAKIASFMADDSGQALAARERAEAEARRYYLLALASERRALLEPVVIAVGGVIAAGKSTVADAVAAELLAPVVDTDRTRKQMLGVEKTDKVHEKPWQGAYSEDFTTRVYAEVLRRARAVLASGRTVVVDASFRSREDRAAARLLARERDLPFYFLECRAAPAVCRERLERRARRESITDGRLEIFDDFVARYEAVEELPAGEHVVVDTEKPLEVERILERIPEAKGRDLIR